MSESWKQWEGQVVDAKFPLHRYLGGSEHSAVFLTERSAAPQKAAIKFVQVEEPDANLQLFLWHLPATLSHPNQLRIFEAGRARLGETQRCAAGLEGRAWRHAASEIAGVRHALPSKPAAHL